MIWSIIKIVRIVSIILTLLLALFWASPAFAAISFSISNPQQSGNEVTIDVSLSGLTSSSCPNVSCYLQAAFTSQVQTRYFGFTKNNSGQWYEYISSPSTTYIQSTFFAFQPTSGAWSGQVTLKINTESSYYDGPGTYNINAWRYTGNSTSGTAITSDVLSINIQGSTPSPSSSSSSTSSPSSTFTISNVPSEIDSTENFNTSVNLSLSSKSNTIFYLKGAFKQKGGSNYFGLTKVGNSWVKNNIQYQDQYKITTDGSGNWSGTLEIQPDIMDFGYEGGGEYIFKVGRYTEDGSLNWSNESNIKINAQAIVLEENNEIPGETVSQVKEIKSTPKDESYSLEKYLKIATPSSAATAAASAIAKVKAEKINFLPLIGNILVIIGIIPIAYAIYHQFRRRNNKIS